jgi:hypothetical protein
MAAECARQTCPVSDSQDIACNDDPGSPSVTLASHRQPVEESAEPEVLPSRQPLEVARAYLDLVQAQGQVAIAREMMTHAEELVRLVESGVKAGTAPPADGLRARVELARLLRLDPAVTLFPVEDELMALCMIDPETPLDDLLSEGLTAHPELAEHRALVAATVERMRQEQWQPWLPTLQVGLSAGGFGGRRGSSLGNFGGRADFDALMVWEVRNLGLGNRALQRERISQHAQAGLSAEQILDTVAAEIAVAYHQRERCAAATQHLDPFPLDRLLDNVGCVAVLARQDPVFCFDQQNLSAQLGEGPGHLATDRPGTNHTNSAWEFRQREDGLVRPIGDSVQSGDRRRGGPCPGRDHGPFEVQLRAVDLDGAGIQEPPLSEIDVDAQTAEPARRIVRADPGPQSPPIRSRSIRATFPPSPAAPAAVTSPTVPAPMTTKW